MMFPSISSPGQGVTLCKRLLALPRKPHLEGW